MKKKNLVGILCLGVLTAGMIPFSVKNDRETGAFEVRSLLWGVRKSYRDGKKYYSFAMPSSGLDEIEEPEEMEEFEPEETDEDFEDSEN